MLKSLHNAPPLLLIDDRSTPDLTSSLGTSWRLVSDTVPFNGFQPYRIDTPLDLRCLRRIGIVAIGRAFTARVCVGRVALYR